jgi:hypothetical protein
MPLVTTRRVAVAATICLAGALPGVALAQPYNFTVNGTTSSLSGTVNADARIAGTLIGAYKLNPVPTETRTLNFSLFGSRPGPPTNIAKNFTADPVASSTLSTRPAGTYALSVNLGANQVTLNALDVDLLGGAAPDAALTTTVTSEPFLTAAPNNSYPFLVPVPISETGTVRVLTLGLAAPVSGALTPTGPGAFSFSITPTLIVSGEVEFSFGVLPLEDVAQPVTLSGTVTVSGSTATATLNIPVDQTVSNTTPQPLPADAPFQLPDILGSNPPANLLLNGNVTRTNSVVRLTIALPAAGTIVCRPDLNNDGELTFDDIQLFVALYNANDARADLNNDQEWTFDDIQLFVSLYNAGC